MIIFLIKLINLTQMNFKSISLFILILTLYACQQPSDEIIREYPTSLLNSTSFLDSVTTAIDGNKLSAPFDENTVINGWTIFIAPGDTQAFHDHNTNMFYFVFEGSLVEETIDGEKRTFNVGDGAISATNECHMNYSIDSDTAKVLLVMIGIDNINPTKPCQ
ncbi:MAG: cupin domain-containing protein [Balneolaceae bacterium]|jgi:quercetin dioxygenase-like cupin family protein|nr:cupin domain-containing protein [Balneolaceae bacterium]